MIVDSNWNTACPSCPSISSKDFWAEVVPLAIKVPSYILVLAIALTVISVIFISYSWIALYWAFSMDNIRRRRIFHKDVGNCPYSDFRHLHQLQLDCFVLG